MGFLDVFRGSKPKLSVAAEPADARPGDEVRVRVTVEGEIDDKAQGARAGVRCVNEYLKREYDRRDDEWEEVWRTVALHEDAQDLPLAAGEHELTFTLPSDLPPSSAGAVSWAAFASIDRRRGMDASAGTPIAVRAPAPAGAAERRSVAPGQDGVGFEALPAAAAAGSVVDGTLTVTPADDVKTTGIRVTLTRTRTYTDDGNQIVRRDDAAEVEVAGGQELAPGQAHSFPFSVALPPDAPPTAHAPHAVVEWWVRGTVARRMRGDLEASAPLTVYDG
ncbi:MAG TPA: sporulation protein [Solirubrobacteraceae bacterium]|jgi:sporulation-control protein spo0M|nr:sporulation protein [Solirubrobacteraceae bacterium]